jgi:2-polyprenyl-6-methoxyphenol hydroxylase-like FAD-dependent oxidoreductase
LAIQDAAATANILATPLHRGSISDKDLHAVQRRREFPTRTTQSMQVFLQDPVIGRVLESTVKLAPPLLLRLLGRMSLLQRMPARLIGIGIRPEHVQVTAEA